MVDVASGSVDASPSMKSINSGIGADARISAERPAAKVHVSEPGSLPT